jgi:hypothetical protein
MVYFNTFPYKPQTMKSTLSILVIALLIASCNSNKKEETKPANKDTVAPPSTDTAGKQANIDTAGSTSMDRIGGLSLGLVDTKLIELLGQPESKSKEVEWGADGLMHQDWTYKSKGIELNMSRDKTTQQIFSITVSAPSNLRTPKSIGIGSSYEEVMAAYEKDIDKEASDKETVVVGSVYGGIIFNFKGGKVDRIFVGAAAE